MTLIELLIDPTESGSMAQPARCGVAPLRNVSPGKTQRHRLNRNRLPACHYIACSTPAGTQSQRPADAVLEDSRNEMTARSVSWDDGPAIPGTGFRHLITGDDTDGRFSAQSAVLAPRELVIPHSHQHEDEYTMVYRGRIGGLVGEEETEVD